MKKKIVGLGVACIDYISTVGRFPKPDEKMVSEGYEMQGGGNCANTLVALTRLGLDTELITKVGTDVIGAEIFRGLKDEGVSTRYSTMSGDRTHFSFIIVDRENMTRTILGHPGPSYSEEIYFPEEVLDNADLVYLDGRFHSSAKRLAELCNERGIPLAVEAERKGHEAEKLFQYATIVFATGRFQIEHFGHLDFERNLDKILAEGPDMVVTTLGDEGAIYKTKADMEFVKVDALPAQVVDTTGAGDAFNAGFLYGYLQGSRIMQCMEFGSWVAARKCAEQGARKGLPYMQDMGEFFAGRQYMDKK